MDRSTSKMVWRPSAQERKFTCAPVAPHLNISWSWRKQWCNVTTKGISSKWFICKAPHVSSPCVDMLVIMWWTEPMDRSALWPPKNMLIKLGCDLEGLGFKNISNLHSSCLPLFQQGQQLELTFQSLAKFSRKTPNMHFKCNQLQARMQRREEGYRLTGLVDHTSELQSCHLNCRKIAGFRFRCDPAAPTSPQPNGRTPAWTCRTPTNQWLEPAD